MSEPRTFRDSELSHIHKEGERPEPSRKIDQAILAAARRAPRRERSLARRWAPGFALAATVVLAFSLFLKVSEEKPEEYGSPLLDRTAPAPARPAESEEALKSTAPPKPAAAPAPPVSQLKKEAPERERAGRMEQSLEARPESPSAAGAVQMREAATATPEQAPSASSQATESNAPPPAAASDVVAPKAASGLIERRSTLERSPQAWLDDIRKLRAAGRIEEANRELAEFRKRYPKYVLPKDLR